MPSQQEQAPPEAQAEPAVATGLTDIKLEEIAAAAAVEAESPPVTTEVLASAEPSELVQVSSLDDMAARELYEVARRDNVARDFTHDVLAARHQPEPVYTPPPVPTFIEQQRAAEMEAGRKAVAKRAAEDEARGYHHKPPEATGSVAVFRPADYVPDPKKNQGHVNARTLSSG